VRVARIAFTSGFSAFPHLFKNLTASSFCLIILSYAFATSSSSAIKLRISPQASKEFNPLRNFSPKDMIQIKLNLVVQIGDESICGL